MESPQGQRIFRIGGIPIFLDRLSNVIYFKAQMTIDADGSPWAYGPNDKGLDRLANAGHPGNWWGVVTDSKGKLIQQGIGDPAPGYYISTTSLQDRKKKITDPARYANASALPFIALPPQLFDYVKLGDIGTAIYGQKMCHFIVADTGGKGHIGEGSIFLAQMLGIDADPRKGGLDEPNVGYTVYPHSGTGGLLLTPSELAARADQVIGARGIWPHNFFAMKMKSVKKIKVRRKTA